MAKKKLLIWADAPTVKTGFGVVSKNLFRDLHQEFEVAILGVNYFGLSQYDTSKYFIYSVERGDQLGLDRFPYILTDFRPELIFLFQDVFNIDYAIPLVKKWNKEIPIVAYFPIDGSPVNRAWEGVFEFPQKLITYTQWGIDRIVDIFPKYKDKIEYLYHGVDTTLFKPLNAGARKTYKMEKGWDNKFVVLNVNRFQPRKMLTLSLRAHALFTKGYKECKCGNVYLRSLSRCDMNGCGPDSVINETEGHSDSLLYVHANTQEKVMGPGRANTLQAHMMNCGFQSEDVNKTIAAFGGNIYENPIPDEELNIVYNVADVNVSVSIGEGVGLSLIEASAAGTTSIAPNHSSIPEMIGDTGYIVPNAALINIALDNAHLRPVVSMKYYLDALETEYKKWCDNGRKKVFNQAAVDRVKKLFVWQDKRNQLLGWLQSYV